MYSIAGAQLTLIWPGHWFEARALSEFHISRKWHRWLETSHNSFHIYYFIYVITFLYSPKCWNYYIFFLMSTSLLFFLLWHYCPFTFHLQPNAAPLSLSDWTRGPPSSLSLKEKGYYKDFWKQRILRPYYILETHFKIKTIKIISVNALIQGQQMNPIHINMTSIKYEYYNSLSLRWSQSEY